VFQDTCKDSPQTKRWFDDTGNILFFHHIDHFFLEADVSSSQHSTSSLHWHLNLSLFFKLCLKSALLGFVQFLEIGVDCLRILLELFADNLTLNGNCGLFFRTGLFELSRCQ